MKTILTEAANLVRKYNEDIDEALKTEDYERYTLLRDMRDALNEIIDNIILLKEKGEGEECIDLNTE